MGHLAQPCKLPYISILWSSLNGAETKRQSLVQPQLGPGTLLIQTFHHQAHIHDWPSLLILELHINVCKWVTLSVQNPGIRRMTVLIHRVALSDIIWRKNFCLKNCWKTSDIFHPLSCMKRGRTNRIQLCEQIQSLVVAFCNVLQPVGKGQGRGWQGEGTRTLLLTITILKGTEAGEAAPDPTVVSGDWATTGSRSLATSPLWFPLHWTTFCVTMWKRSVLKIKVLGFPGGSVVKNLPASAGHMFNPWSRKIPNASEQLSLCTTTTEPVL